MKSYKLYPEGSKVRITANRMISHAIQKAEERYGIIFIEYDLDQIVTLINSDKAIFIEKMNARLSVWQVFYKGIDFKISYDKNLGLIRSFLKFGPTIKEERIKHRERQNSGCTKAWFTRKNKMHRKHLQKRQKN